MPKLMIGAAAKALGDLFSKPFRAVLWKSLALTILLFAALFFGVQLALSYLDLARFEWLEPVIAIVAGLGVLASFIFLATPVTAIFAGLALLPSVPIQRNWHTRWMQTARKSARFISRI